MSSDPRQTILRALRWPLHSKGRLLAVLAAVLLAVIVAGKVNHHSRPVGPSADTATSSPAAVPTSPTTASGSPSSPVSATGSLSPGSSRAALALASAFVRTWAAHPADQAVWQASLDGFCTPTFSRQLASTSGPSAVTATRVTGDARIADTSGIGSTIVVVPTDAGPVSVHLEASPGGVWQVSDLLPGAQGGA